MRSCVLIISAGLAILAGVLLPEAALPDVPAKELAWSFQYDGAGRLTEARDPGGLATKIAYKHNGTRLQQVTRTAHDNSQVVLDLQGNRRASMTDPLGKTEYQYDARGRLRSIQRAGAAKLAYTHDEADRLASVTVDGKWTTAYHYDYLGRVRRITSPAGEIGIRTTGQQVEVTLPNGVRSVRKSNADGTLASVTHLAKDGKELASFAYTYRPDRLVREVKEAGPDGVRTIGYDYDAARRLVTVTDSKAGKTSYTYDSTGNRLSATTPDGKTAAAFDWQDRLTTLAGTAVTHDPSGNVTGYTGTRGPLTAKYDAVGQLASVTTKTATVGYAHDGDGRLVSRSVGEQKTTYTPDPLASIWRPLLETDAAGKQTCYVWLGDTPLAAVSEAGTKFFLGDHLGSPRAAADATGAVTERYEVGPFGEVAAQAGGPRPGFAGLFYDADAGLYLTLARAYDPSLGRFLQRDPQHRMPFGSQKDLSAYAYCGDDPVNFADRDGCQPLPPPPPFLMDRNQLGIVHPRMDVFGDRGEPGPTLGERMQQWDQRIHQGGARLADRLWDSGTWYGRAGGVAVDFLAGMVPGQPANPLQATSGFLTSVGTSFVPGLGVAYNATSFGMNAAGRDRDGMILDAVGMIPGGKGVTAFGEAMLRTPRLGSQLDRLGNLADTIQFSNDIYRLRPETALMSGFRLGSADRGSATDRLTIPPLRNDNRFIPFPPPPGGPGGGLAPSNIGGVALAGGDIKGLGQVQGIAVDEFGRVALIAGPEGANKIALPGLRLDDVVTIFRCVYERGEAPFVSIDPDPKAPRGKTMNVRHDRGTADTYVGWVLFEADRVMKVFTLGVDNLAPFPPFTTKVPGYRSLPNLGVALNEPVVANQWERFWIKVDEVVFRTDKNGQVTLGDVTLRLDTESMVLAQGKLVPAPNAKPSKSAAAFADWFTKNYKKIDDERTSTPPDKNAAVAKKVAIFAELERMAVIAALAERLRDEKVPLPSWMRDYPVAPFAVPKTTPTVTGQSANGRILIFGGAVLGSGKVTVKADDAAANALAGPVLTALATTPSATVVPFANGQEKLVALPLPGATAQGVVGNVLAETDLAVPFADTELRLTRRFNSFIEVRDSFGPAWTLDLPRLEEQKWPRAGQGNRVLVATGHRVSLPLNSLTESFKDIGPVDTPHVRGNIFVPTTANSPIVGLASATDADVPGAKHVVFFHNGQQWFFEASRKRDEEGKWDEGGKVVGIKDGIVSLRYEYADGRLVGLEGREGDKVRAEIQLAYDAAGRPISATAGERTVKYSYDREGHLTEVAGDLGKVGYTYTKARQVAGVLYDGKPIREFAYATGGRLASEKDGDGNEVAVTTKHDARGTTVEVGGTSATYDLGMRPVARTEADGTTTRWDRSKPGEVVTTVTPAGDEAAAYTVVRKGTTATLKLKDGSEYAASFDRDNRLLEVSQAGKPLLTQKYDTQGRLVAASDDLTRLEQRYQQGVLRERTLKAVSGDEWLKITFNASGQPINVTDHEGLNLTLTYGPDGRPQQVQRDGGKVTIERDALGRVLSETTTWGEVRKTVYAPAGPQVVRTEVRRGDRTATVEYERGRPTKVTDFDALTSAFAYHAAGPFRDRLQEVRTADGLVLKYGYAGDDRTLTVTYPGHWRLTYTFDGRGRMVKIAQQQLAE